MENTFANIGGHKLSIGKKYSTSEVRTGDVWIDGKPIYRKVIEFTSTTFSKLTVNAQIIDNTFSTTDKTVRKWWGFIEGTPLPFSYVTNTTISGNTILYPSQALWVDFTGSGVRLLANFLNDTYAANFSNKSGFVVIEYTKTTD